MKKYIKLFFEKFGGFIAGEFNLRQLMRNIAMAVLLSACFTFLPLFAGGSSADKVYVFLWGLLYGYLGYFLMRLVIHQIKKFLLNRPEVLEESIEDLENA
ncbi:MAG: hypothetical protein AAFO07_01095 [Bacteroidota bacterium]